MSTNLANVYAELLRKYGDNYTIAYATPPTYLTGIVGSRELGNKIILFYHEDRSVITTKEFHNTTPSKKAPSKSHSDLDLTGSPLKDDCLATAIADLTIADLKLSTHNPWKLEEEYHRGIKADQARVIICTPEFQQVDGMGSVWFLCDGTDIERTLLLQFEFNKTHFSRGTLSYTGVLPSYMINSQTLVRQHGHAGGALMETFIENSYQVNDNMTLKCTWSTSTPLPTLTETSACEVALAQTFRVSDCSPITQDLMNQLRILLYIREDIINFHTSELSASNREPIYRCGRGIDIDELREAIGKTMTEFSGFAEGISNGHAEYDIEEVVQFAKVRTLADVTDKLWDLLRSCSSYKDLKMGFNILFQNAVRCNIVNMPTNKNRLANIISELANHRLAIPCLSGAEPLELLLEIGMEKLYKDYEFIFTESKVCSSNLLKLNHEYGVNNMNTMESQPNAKDSVPKVRKSLHNAVQGGSSSSSSNNITGSARKTLLHHLAKSKNNHHNGIDEGFKNSNFDEAETLTGISKLLQIHCTLEHLLMIHINLNLNNVYGDVCAQLLKMPLLLVDSIDDNYCDKMDISLPSHYVCSYLQDKEPHSRHITMKSCNKFRELKTTFYLNVENICPPELAQCFQCDDKELIKERTYHTWIYRKISSLK